MKKSTDVPELEQIRLGIKLANLDIKLEQLDELELDDDRRYWGLRSSIVLAKHNLMYGRDETRIMRKAYFRRIQDYHASEAHKIMVELKNSRHYLDKQIPE